MANYIRKAEASSHPPQMLSVLDAARLLGISERFCHTLIQSGQLASIKIGRRRLVDQRDIEAFVRRQKEIEEIELAELRENDQVGAAKPSKIEKGS